MFGIANLENEKTKILVPMQYKKGFIFYTKCVEQILLSVIFFKKIGYQKILAIITLIVDFARLWLGHKDLLTVFGQHTLNFHNFSLILAIFYIYMSDRFRE